METMFAAHILNLADAETERRLRRFLRAWRYYDGDHDAVFKTLSVTPGVNRDNVRVNYCKAVVNKGISYLFGKPVTFEMDADRDTDAERYLEQVWGRRKMITLQKMAMNGGVTGHVFVKIKRVVGALPRIIVLDPSTVTPVYDPDDIDVVLRWKIEYPAIIDDKPAIRRQLIDPQGASWEIVDQIRWGDTNRWQTISTENWPWSTAPVLHCQNLPRSNEFWGEADLEEDLLDLNDSLNFVLSNVQRIIRHHAHPKTWARGVSASQIDTSVDKVTVLNSPDATLANLEMKSDLQSSITQYEQLKMALLDISRTPNASLGGDVAHVNRLSALALRVLFGPLLEKTEVKRATYGTLCVEINRLLLEMDSRPAEDVGVVFKEVLPDDPQSEAQTLAVHRQVFGVSRETILGKLGYDSELEEKRRERENADEGRTDDERNAGVPQGNDEATATGGKEIAAPKK